ncbi:hypothetical protein [Gordonia crocea]|uniref:Uncharacterized protein n=1 Tax=Gordonia crocea TaxID=589162 RepID=A0A7I9V1D4_9ACTN|nr:hypothetical protein [Gordonia crocea]GED98992.1 hypothetical protein nbrc107697_30310 [Gordonia crocea]
MTFPAPGPVAEPPARPALPSPIAIATELWLVVIVAMTVVQVGSYGLVKDAMDKRLAELPKDANESTREFAEMLTNPALIVTSLIMSVVVGAAIALTALYFVRAGYTWARVLLCGLSAWVLLGAAFAFAGSRTWTQVPEIIAAGCAGGALILLMRRESDTYCREMTQFRAAAHRPAGWPPAAWNQPHGPGGFHG